MRDNIYSNSLIDSVFLAEALKEPSSEYLNNIFKNLYKFYTEERDSSSTLKNKELFIFTLLYQIYLDEYSAGFRGVVNVSGDLNITDRKADLETMEKLLYKIYIKPFEDKLLHINELIIVTDGHLAFVPFEALRDGNGRYLVEKYSISYTNSLQIKRLLEKRNYPKSRKSVIAFGGAVYHSDVAADSPVRSQYKKLGISKWNDLPGTLEEVNGIQKTLKDAVVYTGNDVQEEFLKRLSELGELDKFRVLHFATHGSVVDSIPEISALVLSLNQAAKGDNDGYLVLSEIESLHIQADLVNLSACETGKGDIEAGDGIKGIAQSFLIAGANGLIISLWKISDNSTAEFMKGLYEMTEREGVSYPEALNRMKRKFINGEYGERNKSPYYWAPFIYYGR